MKRDNNAINCRAECHYGDYLQCVFSDPEFKQGLKKLESVIDNYLKKNPGKVFVGTFHPDCEPKEAKDIVEKLADEFEISPNDIDELFIFSKDTYYFNFADPYFYPNDVGNQIVIKLWPGTKKQQLLDMWPDIEAQQKLMGKIDRRRNGPEYLDVQYAIHRAKKKGMTYAQISDLLWDGKLPGYSREYKRSKEVLRSYHSKFKKTYLISS